MNTLSRYATLTTTHYLVPCIYILELGLHSCMYHIINNDDIIFCISCLFSVQLLLGGLYWIFYLFILKCMSCPLGLWIVKTLSFLLSYVAWCSLEARIVQVTPLGNENKFLVKIFGNLPSQEQQYWHQN